MKVNMQKILLIGGGRMGTSLVSGWIKKGITDSQSVCLVEVDKLKHSFFEQSFGISPVINIPSKWEGDCLVIAVKPQALNAVLNKLKISIIDVKYLVSIVAGCNILRIRRSIDTDIPIIRSMPNISSSIGLGVTIMNSDIEISKEIKILVEELMSAVGYIDWLKDESLMDLITALSGSGPAYFFLFIDSLVKAGVRGGLNKEFTMNLVKNTLEGSLKLCENESNIEELIDRVTSPGGTTEAALKILNHNKLGINRLIAKAVNAAEKRSKELAS